MTEKLADGPHSLGDCDQLKERERETLGDREKERVREKSSETRSRNKNTGIPSGNAGNDIVTVFITTLRRMTSV